MEERETWGSRAGFIFAAIGSAIGLGNIWRYPYIAYDNGGGAFLIPYLFALLTAGIPILILEYAIGQKMRGSAPLSFRRLSEKWEWLGWWQAGISFFIVTYYMVIVGWALSFTYFSIGRQWGEDTQSFMLGEYLGYLNVAGNIWQPGGFRWQVLLPVVIVWAVTYWILFRGIRRGIQVATTIMMPILIVIMIIITIRGITLPGAAAGLNALLEPNWAAMANPKVWVNAYGQIFFSLSIAFGIMITYASYLPKNSDLANNGFIAALANSGFEFLAALGVFGALGYLAMLQGVPVEEVATKGVVLAFIVFPEIINHFPALNDLFGVLFFGALTLAGLTSAISIAEVCITAVKEKFGMTRTAAVNWVCGLGFLGSLLFVTQAGLGYLDIVDAFVNNYGIVLAGIVEVVLLAWVYKLVTLREHINLVSDLQIGPWWDFSLKFITPLVLIVMSGYNLYNELFVQHYGGGDYTLGQVLVFGWGSAIVAFLIGIVLPRFRWQGEGVALKR